MIRLGLKWWWVLAVGALFALSSETGVAAPSRQSSSEQSSSAQSGSGQSSSGQSNPSASDSPDKVAPKKPPDNPEGKAQKQANKIASHGATATKKSAQAKTGASSAAGKKAGSASSRARRKRPISPRVRRIREAFVASASLRPMAQQLLQDRTPAAYSGVESYARSHTKEDAGALAWLVVGYAHVLDKDYAHAIDPLSHAKPLAGDLGDYVAYYLGTSYVETGRIAEALSTLADFGTTYPDSLLIRDVHVAYANSLLTEGRTQEVVDLLEKDRLPARPDIELAIGRAYATLGKQDKATEALTNVYYNMPTASEADGARAELKKLPVIPAATLAQHKTRAELLVKAKRYNDAIDEYHEALIRISPTDRPAFELALADALHRAGRNREAKAELTTLANATADQNAQRLYILGEVAWALEQNEEFYRTVDQLRQTAPTSSWLESALLSVANLHLVHHEYDQSLDAFRELQQRFPNGSRASYAHWKAAWLTLRQGHNDEAKKAFDEQIVQYPGGNETSAALYWRARLAEEDNQPTMARAYYQKLSDRYRNYYYAELGRQRLKKLPAGQDPPGEFPLLDHIPPLEHSDKVELAEPPADDLHLQKAQLLGNGGLVDFAVRELQAAASADKGNWGPSETAQLYIDTGHYDRAIEVMKKNVPSYFAIDIPTLPRPYWEALFPRPYWNDLKRFSAANGLDPYLVASLIRQESEFNPLAVSRANAVGLMQLLPHTGKTVAGQVRLAHYNASQLYTPAVNMQLGTHYFRGMVDQFGGSFQYALAAYNAGSDRVEEWLGQGKYRDETEFVESIPFTETREYVQAIVRNTNVYKQLYGAP